VFAASVFWTIHLAKAMDGPKASLWRDGPKNIHLTKAELRSLSDHTKLPTAQTSAKAPVQLAA
jgi:hypothetical protein